MGSYYGTEYPPTGPSCFASAPLGCCYWQAGPGCTNDGATLATGRPFIDRSFGGLIIFLDQSAVRATHGSLRRREGEGEAVQPLALRPGTVTGGLARCTRQYR